MIYKYIAIVSLVLISACSGTANHRKEVINNDESNMIMDSGRVDSVYFGAGCFWCLEAILQEVKGVVRVESGYAGGKIARPTYREVSSGLTGHAEVVKVVYDTSQIAFKKLLEIFWKMHDPTTLNRQGADVGTQYRSVIFYMSEGQREEAEYYRLELERQKIWKDPIVTVIEPFSNYYVAEDYHQNYFAKNPTAGYCQFVIVPKLEKYRKLFGE